MIWISWLSQLSATASTPMRCLRIDAKDLRPILDRHPEAEERLSKAADSLLVVSTEIVDPTYLVQPFWTSTHFKRQNDAAGWNPTPCVAR
mgnify:CR=1 FL=1